MRLSSRLFQKAAPALPSTKTSAWTSSHFIEVEFCWVSKTRVSTCNEFLHGRLYELKFEFGDKFIEFWLQYFEDFRVYWVHVSQKYKLSNLNLIEFELWVSNLIEFQIARSSTFWKTDPKPLASPIPSYDQVVKTRKDKLNPGLLTYYKKPLYITQGSMQWLWDDQGQRYLDLFGGIVTVSVGHCHPKVCTISIKVGNTENTVIQV